MNTKKSMTSVFNINKEFDLNLLTIFEAVYHNYSVTKAAEELDLAPSSVSQEVNKLRTFFDDSLFIRKGKQLVPTTVATNIHNITPRWSPSLKAYQTRGLIEISLLMPLPISL